MYQVRQTGRRGAGRHQGRGAQNGHGRGRGGRSGRNIYAGHYTPQAWSQLSGADRQRVLAARQQRTNIQNENGSTNANSSNNNTNCTPRDISQVTTANNQAGDMHSVITMGTATTTQTTSQDRADLEDAGSRMSCRRLARMTTSNRTSNETRRIMNISMSSPIIHSTCELDSHADTCVAGSNCVILEYMGDTVSVAGFNKTHDVMSNIPIVTAAMAYDDLENGITYIMILHQALYLGETSYITLLCLNQLRHKAIKVDDCPIHLSPIDDPSTHSLHFPDDQVCIPLQLQGPISYFETRTPMAEELNNCKSLTLTSNVIWDPHSDTFAENERKAIEIFDSHSPAQRPRELFKLQTNSKTPALHSHHPLSEYHMLLMTYS